MAETHSPPGLAPGFDPDRAYTILLICALAMLIVPVGVAIRAQLDYVPLWWVGTLLMGLTLAVGLAIRAMAQRSSPQPAGLVISLVTLIGLVTLPWVCSPYPAETRPWITSIVPVTMACCALLAQPEWFAFLLVGALVTALAIVEVGGAWDVPLLNAVGDCAYAAVLFLISLAVTRGFGASWAGVRRAQRGATEQYAKARAAESEAQSSALWDAYVHDEVLSELATIAHTRQPAEARAAAERLLDAATQLRARHLPRPSLSTGLIDVTLTHYPTAATELRVHPDACDLPEHVTQALIDATSEALRNAAAYAYPDAAALPGPVIIRLNHDQDRADVRIIDEGVGFSPEAVPIDSLGIALAITGRMRAVGGQARVASTPGVGTIVAISWAPGGGTTSPGPPHRQHGMSAT